MKPLRSRILATSRTMLFAGGLCLALVAAAQSDFATGDAAFARGDYTKARDIWSPLAESGDVQAQWGMAYLYLLGLGVPQDLERGALWAEKSAAGGYVDGLSLLAGLYAKGVGVPKDYAKSLELRKSAAATGDALAQYNLAVEYLKGSAKADMEEVLRLLLSAADQNFQGAMFNLGVLYLRGRKVPQDHVQALAWFERVAAWSPGPNGDDPTGRMNEMSARAVAIGRELRESMTPEEVVEAEKLLEEWEPGTPE